MRIRLIIAFLVVAVSAIASMVVFLRLDSPRQIREFIAGAEMTDEDQLVNDLDNYFNTTGSWVGAENILQSAAVGSHSMHRAIVQRLILTDSSGLILVDTNGESEGLILGSRFLNTGIALHNENGDVNGYLLAEGEINWNTGIQEQLITRIGQAAIRAGILAACIAIVLAILLSWQFLKPIETLTKAVNYFSHGAMDHHVPETGPDELARLAHSFNQMADSLAYSETRRKAMTADIAHELRTPLTVERAQIEAMQDGISPIDNGSLEVLLNQNQHLSRLVDDLRVLALADTGELRLEYFIVDLPILLDGIVQKFSAMAATQNVTLRFECAISELKLETDASRVEQVISNLLSNALRFTPKDTTVTIMLTRENRKAVIRVIDSGRGIPPASLPHIFERFYRADPGRAREDGGTGLGLAIARQLAKVLGGDLIAGNHSSGGAEFVFTLPINV